MASSAASEWLDEMDGMRQMMTRMANVPADEIIGMRAPQLSVAKTNMFQVF